MASRVVLSSILRQRSALPRIGLPKLQQQRCFQISAAACNTEKLSATTMTNKFIAQAKKERNTVSKDPTPFVQIESLPATTTTEDIKKLAREALPEGDKCISEIVFVRNDNFEFMGRCIITMKTPEDAQRVLEYGNRRVMGGNIVKMQHIPKLSDKVRAHELVSVTDATSASGRSVIFTGLPYMTKPEHVQGYLRSRNVYPVEGTANNIVRLPSKKQATVAKFLVKFETESEAWRTVRMFHNTDFVLNKRVERYRLHVAVAY